MYNLKHNNHNLVSCGVIMTSPLWGNFCEKFDSVAVLQSWTKQPAWIIMAKILLKERVLLYSSEFYLEKYFDCVCNSKVKFDNSSRVKCNNNSRVKCIEDRMVIQNTCLFCHLKFILYKGQLISKGHFVFFSILPKNERKISAPVG